MTVSRSKKSGYRRGSADPIHSTLNAHVIITTETVSSGAELNNMKQHDVL
jgi:hypothetical protein